MEKPVINISHSTQKTKFVFDSIKRWKFPTFCNMGQGECDAS